MVNPYAQTRPQPKPKTQINIGQSQALKKFDDFQNKQSSKSTSKDKISTFFGSDEEDSVIRRSSQKFIKTSNEYKGTKVVVKLKSEDDSEFDSDDDDDDDDDEDDETTLTKYKLEAKAVDTAPSTSRQLGSASSLSKRNKVKFETDVAKRRHQTSGSAIADTEDNVTISDELFNKNLILDIQDLDIDDDKQAKTKKATNKTDKVSKKPSRSQKDNRKLSKSTISENIDYSSTTDNDSISKVQSATDITDGANESFDTDSSVQNHLILDINELALAEDADNHVSSKSKNATRKKVTMPTASAKKSNGRSKQTKEPSSIHTVPDGYESSINTEIKDDYEEIFTEKSHQAHEYNDDFISETEPQSTSRRTTKSSLKQYNNKRVSISPKLYVKQVKCKTKTIETQVGDNDFIDKHDLINSLNFYTPSSYLSTKKAYLTNLNRMIEFNTVNHAVDEMIRMNIQFLKNFLTTQRIMYESELESMKPELVDF